LHLTLLETRLVRAREQTTHTMVKSSGGGGGGGGGAGGGASGGEDVSMLSAMQVLNSFVHNW
jgi:hypothetical protein